MACLSCEGIRQNLTKAATEVLLDSARAEMSTTPYTFLYKLQNQRETWLHTDR